MDTARAFPGPSPVGHPADRCVSVPGPGPARQDVPRPCVETGREGFLPADAGRPYVRAGLEALHPLSPCVQPGGTPLHLCHPSPAAPVAAQPPAPRSRERAPRLQHGGQLHHEHELAKLRGGVHHVVFLPNSGTRLSQLRLRRRRHRRGRGARARHRPAHRQDGGQLPGGPCEGDAVPAATHLSHFCGLPGFPGDDPELQVV
ncbi:MAG: hypothetical protein H6Q84_3545 [Deltaproteobacteria bacterium]|nr:hypothetical protein [Deltaproteobacteria bacterium]